MLLSYGGYLCGVAAVALGCRLHTGWPSTEVCSLAVFGGALGKLHVVRCASKRSSAEWECPLRVPLRSCSFACWLCNVGVALASLVVMQCAGVCVALACGL